MTTPLFFRCVETPLGLVEIANCGQYLHQIDLFVEAKNTEQEVDLPPHLTDIDLKQAIALSMDIEQQLQSYFRDPSYCFDIAIAKQGTIFQQKVWQALTEIPIGQALTYGELSDRLDSHTRAIGGACRNNPTPIIVPCHRIFAKSGIGEFSGQWQQGEKIDSKSWLLKHEGAI